MVNLGLNSRPEWSNSRPERSNSHPENPINPYTYLQQQQTATMQGSHAGAAETSKGVDVDGVEACAGRCGSPRSRLGPEELSDVGYKGIYNMVYAGPTPVVAPIVNLHYNFTI